MPEEIEFFQVVEAADLPEGERLFFEIDGQPIVLVHQDGEFFAVGDVCTHDDGPLGEGDVEGCQIVCPRHGARFDLRTGKVLSMPAVVDIPAYPVRVNDGWVEIGWKTEA